MFNFDKVQLTVSSALCAGGVISKNLLPKLRLLKISSHVFLLNFIVLTYLAA